MKTTEIYNKLSANYWFTSLIISGTTFLISVFFMTQVKSLPFDFSSLATSAAMSISIGYQYGLIKSTLSNTFTTFRKLSHLFENDGFKLFSQELKKKLYHYRLCNLTIICVVTPYIILELIGLWKWRWLNGQTPSYFYLYEPTMWSLLLDIFNHMIEYSLLFLLAVIIWIIIELTLLINELKEKYAVNVDVFDVDETGGLRPLRSLALWIVSNYFIIVTLVFISYIPPTPIKLLYICHKVVVTPEIILLVPMLLIGIIFFINTHRAIRNLIDKDINLKLEKINSRYKKIYNEVCEVSSNNNNKKELEELRVVLDILEKEELKIKTIKHQGLDIKTTITFMTTILLPIITVIEEMIVKK